MTEENNNQSQEQAVLAQASRIDNDLTFLTQTLDQLYQDRARLKFELKNIEQEISKNELRLQAIMQELNVTEMTYNVYSFGWQTKTANRLNQALFKEKYPEQYKECCQPQTSASFVFKIN